MISHRRIWTRISFGCAVSALLLLAWCCQRGWSAGGAYSASGHASATTGVNRLPTLYGRGECGHCHEAHASTDADPTLYPYSLFAAEENVCWACHDGTTTYAANAKAPFSLTPANTGTDYYKHPVSNLYSGLTPSLHRAGESAASAFSGGSRHAECTDCHDPHSARNNGSAGNSTHTPGGINGNRLSGALLGATGLVVSSWQAAGQPFQGASRSFQALTSTTSNYEWQLCFKCHSSFATLPTYAAVGSGSFKANKITSLAIGQIREYQDVGQAFNPGNLAFHPVTTQGRNATIPAGSFVSPWSATSTMYCSDCHSKAVGSSGAAGPHGSTNMHVLERPLYLQENRHYSDPAWHIPIGQDPNELCFKCHRWQTYVQLAGTSGADPATNTGFRSGSSNYHSLHMGKAAGVTCYTCHDIHGTNKEHLINFNLDFVTPGLGRDSQTSYLHTSTGGSCYLTCHSMSHTPESYTR